MELHRLLFIFQAAVKLKLWILHKEQDNCEEELREGECAAEKIHLT